ncbi:unnamed protein product [Rotaria socialis]|uniref:Uncharacterized protein n=1 Tax=Rotaria socialis TaxID=392032 RepID=A0A817YEW2_9BILA|nr:unnamed protein product [Rotaria socialis]
MEFNPEGLGQFIHRLVVQQTTDAQESDVEVTDDDNNSSANATDPNRKRYCLMIFNDPKLSRDLKNKTKRQQETANRQQRPSQVTTRTVATTTSSATTSSTIPVQQDEDDDDDDDEEEEEEEEEDDEEVLALNLRISRKLEKLVNKFMNHQRIIPMGRYYLDLTNPK